jgi:hypothetical protein
MKNATKHADQLKSLNRKLVRDHKPEPRVALEPLLGIGPRRDEL